MLGVEGTVAQFSLQASHSIVWCVQNALLVKVEQVVRNY